MITYLASLCAIFFTSTVILCLVNYKINKTLKRTNEEAQYWCELYIKTTKQNKSDEYEDII
jgi:hypothetical protein